jgi:hypothetical protein
MVNELNPRRRVYVEIPKPSRVELIPEALTEGFDVILEGLISILKCLQAKCHVLSLPGGSWLSYQDPLHSERG